MTIARSIKGDSGWYRPVACSLAWLNDKGTFDQTSFNYLGTVRIADKSPNGNGMCQYLNADEDKIGGSFARTGASGSRWRNLRRTTLV